MSKPIHHAVAAQLPIGVERAARDAASGTKTDFKSLLASSLSETRHNPLAQNKRSSATAAYQSTERTWLDLVRRYGAALGQGDAAAKITVKVGKPRVDDPADRASILALRSDSSLAGALAARYSDENRTALGKSLGRKVNENEVRIAYLLGATGASRLLRAAHDHPAIGVDKVVPSAVRSNPGLFRQPNGAVKTAGEAVAPPGRHFDREMRPGQTAGGGRAFPAPAAPRFGARRRNPTPPTGPPPARGGRWGGEESGEDGG